MPATALPAARSASARRLLRWLLAGVVLLGSVLMLQDRFLYFPGKASVDDMVALREEA